MTTIAHVFLDAGLTTAFDDATHTLDAFALNGGSDDGVFYIGSDAATGTTVIEAASDPGIDQLVVSISDSAPGTGVEAAHIKLALTQLGLDSAVAGDPLNIGTGVTSGAANAVPVWYRWDNSVGASTYTEISLGLSAREERVV